MRILKFEEYISERLWSKGIERSESNGDRIEDKLSQDEVFDIFEDVCDDNFFDSYMKYTDDFYKMIKELYTPSFQKFIDTFPSNKDIEDDVYDIFGGDAIINKGLPNYFPDFEYKLSIDQFKELYEKLGDGEIIMTYDNKNKFKCMCNIKYGNFDITNTYFVVPFLNTISEICSSLIYGE